jgi:putative hemolysin
VYVAQSRQISAVLPEIGRLRETCFRGVGEGTGRTRDLDSFDESYEHLFLSHEEKREVAGAYRLRLVHQPSDGCDSSGLYSNTLFRVSPAFLASVTPGIELGRSFIREEYQRSPQPLFYLWRGIGIYVSRLHPEVRYLFGPVSISNTYQNASRELIVEYFREHDRFPLAVNARNPFRLSLAALVSQRFQAGVRDLTELSDVIGDLETDGKEMPVLLRHYLGLGARVAGFNVDKEFADALDALIVVDLVTAPARMLEKYMGREEVNNWRAQHLMAVEHDRKNRT